MTPIAPLRQRLAAALLAAPFALLALGCGESVAPTGTTGVPETPAEVIDPQPPAADPAPEGTTTDALPAEPAAEPEATESEPAPEPTANAPAEGQAATTPSLVAPTDLAAAETEGDASSGAADGVELVAMDFEAFRSKALVKPEAKLTVVDAWATWCGPCKENFPHLVEMHKAFQDQGLNTVSLAIELDPSDQATVGEAEAFLRDQGATFTNVLLTEELGAAFETLDINSIPAVFLYDPSGQEIGRFTGDDPNNQFDYDGVEQVIAALLQGETPPDVKGYFPADGAAEE